MKIHRFIFILILLITTTISSYGQHSKSENPWFFLQITDPQFGMFTNNANFEKETKLYEKAIESVNMLNPEFVIITGDFVHNQNSADQIKEFKRITSLINNSIPVYYTPGNHDIGQTPTKNSIKKYKKNYGSDRFSFMHKNSLFIGINSGLIKAGLEKQEAKQNKWLIRQLEKGKDANQVIVFCHYPFFNKSVDEPEAYSNIGPEARDKYLALFDEYGVDAVFAGHYHNNALNTFNGVELVTTSAVGKPLGKAPSGFRVVKVETDNTSHKYFGLEEMPKTLRVN